jgi:formyl-CoA transferase
MSLPLEGLLVVSVEQAVAAPQCTCRLADAGARVIKVERPEGDFARAYDYVVHSESANFVWLNRGKESLILDLTRDDDKAVLEAMLAKADVFVQNLKPGALAKLGFPIERLRKDYSKLICASISGYGETGPFAQRKAYDLLIQAESGVSSVTGGADGPARVGVSFVDVAAGLNAYEAILEALIKRGRTGEGAAISVSMFDAMAEWMTVPLLHGEGGTPFKRIGLAHAGIAPYGVFKSKDGGDILIAVQNDREWRVLADKVLDDASLGSDPKFATNPKRVENRVETDAIVAAAFAKTDVEGLSQILQKADIAFARVNDWKLLSKHPHLRRITVGAPSGPVSTPAPAPIRAEEPRRYGDIPKLGQHSDAIRREFAAAKKITP